MSGEFVPLPYVVKEIGAETADTATVQVEPADSSAAFAFTPGQFSMLYSFGVGEIPVSISGDPSVPTAHSYTVRALGAVLSKLGGLSVGDTIGVRGPYGRGWPLAAARGKHLVLVAGGLGLAPLRSVIYEALHKKELCRSLTLLYGARSPDEMLFGDELKQWAKKFQVGLIVDVSKPRWRGEVGVVTKLLRQIPKQRRETLVFMCGPEVMMRFCTAELRQLDIDAEQIYISMERNMKCALGLCGRCQLGPEFICKDGPVFGLERIAPLLATLER